MECIHCKLEGKIVKMVIMDEKKYSNFAQWKPQSYVCPECGNLIYI